MTEPAPWSENCVPVATQPSNRPPPPRPHPGPGAASQRDRQEEAFSAAALSVLSAFPLWL